ncbi:MAG: 3-oxoacyl-ACP synthase [Lachnospirales bacterium]
MNVGILGLGTYLPENVMSAKDISEATKGAWSEDAVINKLGIKQKPIPGVDDGTQEMAVKAGLKALENAKISPLEIDVILCMGEEWKEYPLSTSALYIQDKIGALNAWGIDVQNRCCTSLSALKMAKAMIIGDDSINTIMIVGGYRNGDLVDYTDNDASMLYNLGAGAGAMIVSNKAKENFVLGSHILGDGSMCRDAHVKVGGVNELINSENMDYAYKSLTIARPKEMKAKLNATSMENWFICIDKALEESGLTRDDIDYLGILHFKKSMHNVILDALNLDESQSIYLEDYGHIGQVDQILSMELGLKQGKIKKGSNVLLVAAGIGYVWSASVVKWGV